MYFTAPHRNSNVRLHRKSDMLNRANFTCTQRLVKVEQSDLQPRPGTAFQVSAVEICLSSASFTFGPSSSTLGYHWLSEISHICSRDSGAARGNPSAQEALNKATLTKQNQTNSQTPGHSRQAAFVDQALRAFLLSPSFLLCG